MNGELKICPGPGYVIAVLANMDPPARESSCGFHDQSFADEVRRLNELLTLEV